MPLYTPLSFWEYDTWFNNIDVAIIGGGIVGMNAALRLKEEKENMTIAIFERSSVGTAASSRNAGFSCFGSPSELVDDLEHHSEDDVFNLVEMRVKGLEVLRKTVGDKALRYEDSGGFEMFLDSDELQRHLDQLEVLNARLKRIDPGLQFYQSSKSHGLQNIAGVIANDWEGQIHPGYMTQTLRRKCHESGIRILNGVPIDALKTYQKGVSLTSGDLKFDTTKVIICNNGFASSLVGDQETQPGRNIVFLTKPIKDLSIKGCYHFDKGYVYFRNVGNRLLLGGGRNQAKEEETISNFGINENVEHYLSQILDQHILSGTHYEIEHQWSGILGFNKSKHPRVECIESNVFVAVGLGGMGVAIGSLIGRAAAELLLQS